MSATAYDHHNIDCSQPSFFREIELLRSVMDGHPEVKCTEGRVSGFMAGGGGKGRKVHTLSKGRPICYSSPGHNLGQKM